MAHLLRYEEWNIGEQWYCGDHTEFPHKGSICSLWWAPARMLNMSLDDYVKMLIEEFKVDKIKYFEDTDVLVYSWSSQSQMRIFKNWINRKAREHQFIN